MKPIAEWTDADLKGEHDAASYFLYATDDTAEAKRAEQRMSEIEAEWDRREELSKAGAA
jgi:hypothetical protein